jgi:tRNA 5-methylaminomethyl-2-thiouridine biosynthesis bifunctional protein
MTPDTHFPIALQSHWRGRSSFTFLDLDFDDGRGLLAIAAASLRDPDAPQCLHYFAVTENRNPAVLAALAAEASTDAARPASGPADASFAACAMALSRAWMPLTQGFQRLILADGRLVLTLVSGDALANNLAQLDLAFDAAWCRWSDATPMAVRWLGRLAAMDGLLMLAGSVADADSAAGVRQDLVQAGFSDGRQPAATGVGADVDADAEVSLFRFSRRSPFRSTTRHRAFLHPIDAEKHAIVIGAGLAGAAACHRLAARGWRCTLIEQHAAAAQMASGNAAGIFMPVLSQDDNPLSRLSRAAFLFALHIWEGLGGVGAALPGQACGVLQLARSDAAGKAGNGGGEGDGETESQPWNADPDPDRLRSPPRYPPDFARRLSAVEAGAALGQRVAGGWWFPAAGWLQPAAVCEAMLAACGDRVNILYRRQAVQLLKEGGIWHAIDAAGSRIAQAPVVVLANGVQATQFAQAAHLPLSAIRGQVTHLPLPVADMPFVVCGDAYLTPATQRQGFASLGATYDHDADTALRLDSHRQNIRHLQQMLPDWTPPSDVAALDGRVGFRCVAPDRLPLVGALPDPAHLSGSADTRLEQMPRLPGLHGLLGVGSRGLIWAPLAAELLAAQLNGEPSPLPRNLAALLDPARFALKERRRD